MGWVYASGVVLVAPGTAHVAERRGQSGLLWFGLGLLFPGVALLIAAALRPTGPVAPVVPSVGDAARTSLVARHLYESPRRSAHEIATATRVDEREVVLQLAALEGLGLAVRDGAGRWSLTEDGAYSMGEMRVDRGSARHRSSTSGQPTGT